MTARKVRELVEWLNANCAMVCDQEILIEAALLDYAELLEVQAAKETERGQP